MIAAKFLEPVTVLIFFKKLRKEAYNFTKI